MQVLINKHVPLVTLSKCSEAGWRRLEVGSGSCMGQVPEVIQEAGSAKAAVLPDSFLRYEDM